MLYAIMGTDSANSLKDRLRVRPPHLERLGVLQEQGRVALAGPLPAIDDENPGDAGFTGSLIVAEFESLEAAKTWINADPYVTEGVFETVVVKPFKKVIP